MKISPRLFVLLPILLLPVASCGGGSEDPQAEEMTRRQKDSLISTMPIPGAGGVGKALRTSDSLAARAARHDSLMNK